MRRCLVSPVKEANPLRWPWKKHWGRFPWLGRIFSSHPPMKVGRDELDELGEVARIDRIPGTERDALLAAVIPEKPLAKEHARIGTYAALLILAKQNSAIPSETDLFRAACSLKRFGEPLLDPIADGWLTYCVRDAIAVSHEAVLAAVIARVTLRRKAGNRGWTARRSCRN